MENGKLLKFINKVIEDTKKSEITWKNVGPNSYSSDLKRGSYMVFNAGDDGNTLRVCPSGAYERDLLPDDEKATSSERFRAALVKLRDLIENKPSQFDELVDDFLSD